jgi:hypothetical protein
MGLLTKRSRGVCCATATVAAWLIFSPFSKSTFGKVPPIRFASPTSNPTTAGAETDVVAVAYSYKDGGGYVVTGDGCPEAITFKGKLITAKGVKGTYCCGITFAVAMRVATARGLLSNFSVDQIRAFQQRWYGVRKDSQEQLIVTAMEHLGIGKGIPMEDARPGDFVQFWRFGSGHSVVFLNWEKKDGEIVGIRYRSSQRTTDGIGDHTEFFKTDLADDGGINRKRFYVGRLLDRKSAN